MENTMTIAEIAKWLDLPRGTVWTWVNTGKLPNAAKRNRYADTSPYDVPVSDVLALLEAKGTEAPVKIENAPVNGDLT